MFQEWGSDKRYGLIYDEPALRDIVRKGEELDASADVFTVCAHDWSLKGVIDEWPKPLNSWKEKGWKDSTRWKFLEDSLCFPGPIPSSGSCGSAIPYSFAFCQT